MLNTKNEQPKPGLWPDGETEAGLQRSLLFYEPNKLRTHNHLRRFFDYLQLADPVRAFSTLTKMYFHYISQNVNELEADDLEEYCFLLTFFADVAVAENEYVAEDRLNILEDLYKDGFFKQPGRGHHEQK